jgi:hypothetical protein
VAAVNLWVWIPPSNLGPYIPERWV